MMSEVSDVHVFALQMGPPLLKSQWNTLIGNLPSDEQVKILKYRQWQDRQRALLGNILVRWVIQKATGMQPIRIARNETGRPFLVSNDDWKGDFNLSHAGDWIVVALTSQGHVGVDVEKMEHFDDKAMAYALSEAELNVIHQQSSIERNRLFYEYWTMKEAIYKTGLFPITTPQSLDIATFKHTYKTIHTHLVYVDQEHPVSICWDGNVSSVKLTVLDRTQIV